MWRGRTPSRLSWPRAGLAPMVSSWTSTSPPTARSSCIMTARYLGWARSVNCGARSCPCGFPRSPRRWMPAGRSRSTSRSSRTKLAGEPRGTGSLAYEVAALLVVRGSCPSIRGLVVLARGDRRRARLRAESRDGTADRRRRGSLAALATAREHGHGGLHPFYFSVDAALVTACRKSGMAIRTWTVDDPAQIAALAELGVDAVVTNDVVAARRALGRSDPPDGTG